MLYAIFLLDPLPDFYSGRGNPITPERYSGIPNLSPNWRSVIGQNREGNVPRN